MIGHAARDGAHQIDGIVRPAAVTIGAQLRLDVFGKLTGNLRKVAPDTSVAGPVTGNTGNDVTVPIPTQSQSLAMGKQLGIGLRRGTRAWA